MIDAAVYHALDDFHSGEHSPLGIYHSVLGSESLSEQLCSCVSLDWAGHGQVSVKHQSDGEGEVEVAGVVLAIDGDVHLHGFLVLALQVPLGRLAPDVVGLFQTGERLQWISDQSTGGVLDLAIFSLESAREVSVLLQFVNWVPLEISLDHNGSGSVGCNLILTN